MAVNLDALLIQVVVIIILIAPFLWLAGRGLVCKRRARKARFIDTLWIDIIGTSIGSLIHFAFSGMAATVIVLVLWLALIKHFFDCGWLKAFLIALVATVIFAVVGVALAAIGFLTFRSFLPFP